MSLVVLRSWSDGQPPKIRGIAPPDSDDKNEIVVPDLQGRFVTEELPKGPININVNNKVGVIRERFTPNKHTNVTKSNSSASSEFQNLYGFSHHPRIGRFWNKKSLPISPSSSLSPNSLSPSPTNNKESMENENRERMEKLNLSRESSLQSLPSTEPDSSPSSPIGASSRYKNLGPELAATIPKRQIIRDTWVRDSYSIFRKKELSKSTPTLNLSLEEDRGDDENEELEYESERGRRSSAVLSSGPGPKLKTSSLSRPKSNYFLEKDKSWKDSVYGAEFEPKFGDKPASVVGVIKKSEKDKGNNNSISPPKVPALPAESNEPEDRTSPVSPARPNSFFATSPPGNRKSMPVNFNNFTTSSESDSPDTVDKRNSPPNADLRRVKREAKKAVRSVSFELDLHFNSKGNFDGSEFPVHRAVHQSLPLTPELNPDFEGGNEVVIEVNSDLNKVNDDEIRNEIKVGTRAEVKEEVTSDGEHDADEEIDLELDALRGESSSCESERESLILEQGQDFTSGQNNKIDESVPLPILEDMNFRKSLQQQQFDTPPSGERDRRDANRNSHGHGNPNGTKKNHNGSAWAQVPVQCVNRHVIIPAKAPTVPSPVKPNTSDSEKLMNGNSDCDIDTIDYGNKHNRNVNINVNGKSNLRRKNFCDELLSNVVLQVPPLPPPPPAAIMMINERPNSPSNAQENHHDGIIIFDEEDEFEESETESIALSERENSFEYLSVFQNVKVGSPTDTKFRPSEHHHLIGLDLGSNFSRHSSLNKSSGTLKIGDTFRTLVTSDGLAHGTTAIYHSMATKSKLIYKWRARQTFPYDPYDDEDNSSILEVLFKHYADLPGLRPESSDEPSGLDAEDGIPVQWNVSVHSRMEKKQVREAAFTSGLVKSTDELRLVNESTAAGVLAYQFLKANVNTSSQSRKGEDKTFLSINIGSTYFHTSSYSYSGDGLLQMIESGDSQTFHSPESSFTDLLARVFSREFLLKYESRFTPSWAEILIRFEQMKDNYIKTNSECYLFLPVSFFLEFFKCTGIQVPECIEDNPEEGIVWDNNGAIRFTKDLIEEWLAPTLSFIKARVKNAPHYDAIVLSGGSANESLRKQLELFVPSNVNVHLLDNPETTVVQGLVKLDSVKLNLKSPFSIGVGVMTPFDESVHPQEKCVTRSGKKWCSDVWDNLIKKGQPMIMGEVVLKRTYVGAQPGQNVLVLPIFKSDLEEPRLVTSPSVEKCCELRFEINKEKSWREVQLVIKCCDRELSIVATGNDGDVSHVVIDF